MPSQLRETMYECCCVCRVLRLSWSRAESVPADSKCVCGVCSVYAVLVCCVCCVRDERWVVLCAVRRMSCGWCVPNLQSPPAAAAPIRVYTASFHCTREYHSRPAPHDISDARARLTSLLPPYSSHRPRISASHPSAHKALTHLNNSHIRGRTTKHSGNVRQSE